MDLSALSSHVPSPSVRGRATRPPDRLQKRSRRLACGWAAVVVVVAAVSPAPASAFGPVGLDDDGALSATYSCATEMLTGIVDLARTDDFASMTVHDSASAGVTYSYGGPLPSATQVSVSTPARDLELSVTDRGGTTTTPLISSAGEVECFAGLPVEPGYLVTVDAERLFDSRGGGSGSRLAAGAWTPVTIGYPANDRITAVVVNVTAVDTAGPGFVSLSGIDTTGEPSTSTLNITHAGQIVANQAIVSTGRYVTEPVDDHLYVYTSSEAHIVVDLVGYFVGNDVQPVSAGRFTAVTPRRVLDTRPATAIAYGGPKPADGSTTRVRIDGAGIDSATAGAALVNIIATDTVAAGWVQAARAGTLVPGATSTVNFERAGQTVANLAIVPLSPAGEIDLYALRSTHLVVDVLGWFTNSSAGAGTAGMFMPVVPDRFLDTRTATAVSYAARTVGGVDLDKPGPSSPDVTVTFRAFDPGSTIAINLTATASDSAGWLQAAATGTLVTGAASNVNMGGPGDTVANGAFVATDAAGRLDIHASVRTHIVGDVVGIFTSD